MEQRISAARSGSGEALGQLLAGCRNYLLLIANQELHADLQAKVSPSDIVQETFLDAQRDFPRFTGRTREELLAWLRQILLNNIRDEVRKYRDLAKRDLSREMMPAVGEGSSVLQANHLPDIVETPSWLVEMKENHEALYAALGRLSEDHRRVITYRNFELKSFVEIAREMNRTPDAVRKVWVRALEALQRELGDLDGQ